MSREALLQPAAGTELSLQEWAALPEDDLGELVDGRLEEVEAPELVHEVLVAALCHLLRAWARPRGGLVAGSGVKLAVGEHRGRMPDVAVFLPGNLPPARGRSAAGLRHVTADWYPSTSRRPKAGATGDGIR